MGNSLRCCLACLFPCGALDLIRIVHLDGCVEEITGRVTAGVVLKNNPNHVLTKPCCQGMTRRILILSPKSELKRGSIYFLIPISSLPAEKNSKIGKELTPAKKPIIRGGSGGVSASSKSDYTAEKKHSSRHRRDHSKSTAGMWRPHLESIYEDL